MLKRLVMAVVLAVVLAFGFRPAQAQLVGPSPSETCVLFVAESWVTIKAGMTVSYAIDTTECPDEVLTAVFYGHVTDPHAQTIKGKHDVALSVTDTETGVVYTDPAFGPSDEVFVTVPVRRTHYVLSAANVGRKPRTIRVTWLVPSFLAD